MPENKKLWFPVIGAVCGIYIFLRFWHLTDSCLWFDEVFSLHASEHGWGPLFSFISKDLIHPPLFYILLKLWVSFAGETLFIVRLFPVLFSILALIPFFLLARQLRLSYPSIALAFFIFAVNGYIIKYAQEVRMYSLLLCLSLFSLWLFARFLNVGKGIWFLTIVNILLVYTHYFGWLLVFGEILAVLYLQRIKIGQILFMTGVTIVGFIPWMITVLQSARINGDLGQNLGWANRPDLFEILRFVFNLNEPFYFQASNINPISIFVITLPIFFFILTATGIFLSDWKNLTERDKNGVYFLVIILVAPVLVSFVFSWILPFSIWGTRHLIVIFAPYSILVAKIFELIPQKRLKGILVGGLVLLFINAFAGQIQRGKQTYIWCAWENLASQIKPQATQPVQIFVFEDETAYLLWFALKDQTGFRILKVAGIPEIPETPEDKAYFLPRGFDLIQTKGPEALTGERFYIAFRAKEFNYQKQPMDGLTKKGYRIGVPMVFEAQGLRAFLVEINR